MALRQNRIFLRSVARDFKNIGAIAPSSAALGQAMASDLTNRPTRSVGVLEVGGGTGSITRVIARSIRAGDHLDVYEINAAFASVIRARLEQDAGFVHARSAISVHNLPIQSIDRKSRYDFIISCLPFTNFDAGMVRDIFEIYRHLLNPGGVCSFFEYALLRKARRFMAGTADDRRRIVAVSEVVAEYVDRYCYKRDFVFMNLPPAVVHHIRFTPAAVL